MPQWSTCDLTALKHVTEHFLVIAKFALVCSLCQALYLMTAVPCLPVQRSRSRSMSVMAREELCKSEILYNAYAELNVPNYGVDIDIPSDVDYYTVNQARKVASDTVSGQVDVIIFTSMYIYPFCLDSNACRIAGIKLQ